MPFTLRSIPSGELRIRLARWGARRNPFYGIVVGPKGSKRDGKHFERLGTYNPIPEADHAEKAEYLLKIGPRRNSKTVPPTPRVKHIQLNTERVKFWIAAGAEPTDRVAWILAKVYLFMDLFNRTGGSHS
jgi:small subunit ribosomal protein S16